MLKRIALSLVIALLFVSPALGARAIVDISGYSLVKGRVVLLGDIAKISGRDVALVESLKRVPIASAPSQGEAKEISLLEIRNALLKSGLNLEGVLFRVPRKIVVACASRGSLDRVLGEYLISRFGESVSWRVFSTPSLPPDARFKIVTPGVVRRDNFYIIPIVYYLDDGSIGRVDLRVRVSVRKSVVVALRDLTWHEVINDGDVALVEREVDPLLPACTSLFQVLGKRLKKPVRKGNVILKGFVESPPVVRRGSPVVIVARVGAVEVRAKGKACGNGSIGQEIVVLNVSTGKKIRAVVLGPGLVQAVVEGGILKCGK